MERFDSCFHPHHACDPHPNEYHENIHYTPDQINALLGLIPYKADRAEVPKMETLNDVNYIGHVATSEALPDKMEQPSWALVGSVKKTKPYFYYVEGFVPKGYRAGWNDLSGVLGTYDLTVDKVSIFDYNLLTEYNVSRNHTQDTRIFSHDWKEQRYFSAFPDYVEGKKYRPCDRVNMPGYTKTSFVAQRSTSEVPFVVKKSNVFTFEDAIALVPEEYRIPGMKVTFVSAYTNQAETWYFKGNSASLWKDKKSWWKIDLEAERNEIHAEEVFIQKMEAPEMVADRAIADENGNRIPDTYLTRKAVRRHIEDTFNDMFIDNPPTVMDGMITPEMLSESTKQLIGNKSITNFADDEDITSVHGQLKLANKRYDPNNYSGKGRCYLRKNLVAGRNILTQSMVCRPNTIYVIQYDYSLEGNIIIIPEGSVLEFEGGNCSNGCIHGNNTNIKAGLGKIFENIDFSGTWQIIESYPEWFGAKGDGITNDTDSIQKCCDFTSLIKGKVVCNRVYLIDTINIKNITITNTARSNYYNQKNSLTLEEIKIYIKSCFIKNSDNICIHSIDCNLVNINIYGNNKRGEAIWHTGANVIDGVYITNNGDISDFSDTEFFTDKDYSALYVNAADVNNVMIIQNKCDGIQFKSITDHRFTNSIVTSCRNGIVINTATECIINNVKSEWNNKNNLMFTTWVNSVIITNCIFDSAMWYNILFYKTFGANVRFVNCNFWGGRHDYPAPVPVGDDFISTKSQIVVWYNSSLSFTGCVFNKNDNTSNWQSDIESIIGTIKNDQGSNPVLLNFTNCSSNGTYKSIYDSTSFIQSMGYINNEISVENPSERINANYIIPKYNKVKDETLLTAFYSFVGINEYVYENNIVYKSLLENQVFHKNGLRFDQVKFTTPNDKYPIFTGGHRICIIQHDIVLDTGWMTLPAGEIIIFIGGSITVKSSKTGTLGTLDLNGAKLLGHVRITANVVGNTTEGGTNSPYSKLEQKGKTFYSENLRKLDIWTGVHHVNALGFNINKATQGNSESRPAFEGSYEPNPNGYVYFDTTLQKPLFFKKVGVSNLDYTGVWIEADGLQAGVKRAGSTELRPTGQPVGFCYFDTTLGRPIWWAGPNWVDATGATV